MLKTKIIKVCCGITSIILVISTATTVIVTGNTKSQPKSGEQFVAEIRRDSTNQQRTIVIEMESTSSLIKKDVEIYKEEQEKERLRLLREERIRIKLEEERRIREEQERKRQEEERKRQEEERRRQEEERKKAEQEQSKSNRIYCTFEVSFYTTAPDEGSGTGMGASGEYVQPWVSIALPKYTPDGRRIPFYSTATIEGLGTFINHDTGSYIQWTNDNVCRVDVCVSSKEEAFKLGRFISKGYIDLK